MADERTKIDANQDHTIAGVTYDASEDIMNLTLNPVDKRLRVDSAISDVGDGSTSAKQDTQQATLDAILAGTVTSNPFNGYGFYEYEDGATYLYVMYQNTAGAWILKRMTQSTGLMNYAKGSSDAATAWTNRASQSFADYDGTFS